MNAKSVLNGIMVGVLSWGSYKLLSSNLDQTGNSSGDSSRSSTKHSMKKQNQQAVTENDIRRMAQKTVMAELGEEFQVLKPQVKTIKEDANQLKKQHTSRAQDVTQTPVDQVDALVKSAGKLKKEITKLSQNITNKQ